MSSRQVFLYRGFHSEALVEVLKTSWNQNDFVLLIPPQINNFSFLQIIKAISSQINFIGPWPDEIRKAAQEALELDCAVRVTDQETLVSAVIGVFTSGTASGKPRLVFYSKKNILSSLESIRELFDTDRIKKIFVYPQPTHCFGLILGYLQSIIYGHQILFSAESYSKKAHARWLEVVDENTLTLGAPVHFADLIQYTKDNKKTFKSSYSAIIGGASVTIKLWMQLQSDLKIASPSVGYGGTEASPGLTHLPPGIQPSVDGDIGFALKNVEIKNNEKQILFSGPNACLAIYENILLKTDCELALADVLGVSIGTNKKVHYSFIGRSDLLINRGGQKISLEKIENLIAGQFNARCIAVPFYDARLSQDIALIVETQSDTCVLNRAELQDLIGKECGFKISAANIFFAPAPLNTNNKPDRKEALKIILKERKWSFPIDVGYVKPFLPHCGPAAWIDRLISTDKNTGITETTLKAGAKYFVNGALSESSLIEFMAQSYGYTLAINDILNIQNMKFVTKTLIAEVKDSKFNFNSFDELPQVGDVIQVETIGTHDFGALKVVQGKVFYKSKVLATLNMKLYCN